MSKWSLLTGTPADEQIFAIGDIHGQAATLEKTLKRIADAPRNGQKSHLVFLGDLIDRGPENVRSVELAMNSANIASVDKVTILPGNHELMLMDALSGSEFMLRMWLGNGGDAVLNEIDPKVECKSVEEVIAILKEKLGNFIDLVSKSPNHLRISDIIFVHAGINPHYDMDEFLARPPLEFTSMPEHWAWVREPFLNNRLPFGGEENLIVVHGHTAHNNKIKINPSEVSDYLDCVRHNRRICLDAGAAEMGQIGLLQVNCEKYNIDVIHEVDYNPSLDDIADKEWWEVNSPD